MSTQSKKQLKKQEKQTAGAVALQWLGYILWAGLIAGSAWLVAITAYSLAHVEETAGVLEALPYLLSIVLVLAPAAIVTDFFYRKREHMNKVGAEAFVMVLHAALFALTGIGLLIGLLFILVSTLFGYDDLEDGLLPMLTAFITSIVLLALLVVRTVNPRRSTKLPKLFSRTMTVFSVIIIVAGFAVPSVQAARTRDDRLIEAGLPIIATTAQDYILENEALPDSLEALDFSTAAGYNRKEAKAAEQLVDDDMVTYTKEDSATRSSGAVEYRYELCVDYTFEKESRNNYAHDESEYASRISTYHHPKGEVCYKLYVVEGGNSYYR